MCAVTVVRQSGIQGVGKTYTHGFLLALITCMIVIYLTSADMISTIPIFQFQTIQGMSKLH